MELVEIWHPDLKWGKKVPAEKAQVLQKSGWVIKTVKQGKSVTATPTVATTKTKPSDSNEPTPDTNDSVSSPQENSEE